MVAQPFRSRPRSKAKPPVRNPNNVTFSVSGTAEDLALIDARAKSLGLGRSSYIVAVCRNDCANHREFVIIPKEKVLKSSE